MSVVVRRDDGPHLLICKGAVEELFAISHALRDRRRDCGALDPSHLEAAQRETEELNADGFRVVAVAYKELPPEQTRFSVADEARSDAARLYRLSRSAQGERAPAP